MTRYMFLFTFSGRTLAEQRVTKQTISNRVNRRQTENYVLKGHTNSINSLSYHPDGTRLVSGSMDRTVMLWNTTGGGGSPIKTITGNNRPVWAVLYNPDGTRMASGSADNTIKVWDMVDDGVSLMNTLEGHVEAVLCLSYNHDGSMLASGSKDATIKIWNMNAGGLLIKTLQGHDLDINDVSFNPDGTRLASGGNDNTIKIWDMTDGGSLIKTLYRSAPVKSLSYNHDGSRLASGNLNYISIWDTIESGTFIGDLKGHDSSSIVESVSYSPNGRQLASGGTDATVIIWKMADVTNGGDAVITLNHRNIFSEENIVDCISYSSDGLHIASGLFGGDIFLWQFGATDEPTTTPSNMPSPSPTNQPTKATSSAPSKVPTTNAPSKVLTIAPNNEEPVAVLGPAADQSPIAVYIGVGTAAVVFLVLVMYFGRKCIKSTLKNVFEPAESIRKSTIYETSPYPSGMRISTTDAKVLPPDPSPNTT